MGRSGGGRWAGWLRCRGRWEGERERERKRERGDNTKRQLKYLGGLGERPKNERERERERIGLEGRTHKL